MKLKYKDHIRIKCWIKCVLICLKNRFITPPRVLSDHGQKVRYSLSRRFHYSATRLYLHLPLLSCQPGEWAPAEEGWLGQSDSAGQGLSSWPLAGVGPVFKFILPVCSPACGPCYLRRCPCLVRIRYSPHQEAGPSVSVNSSGKGQLLIFSSYLLKSGL